MKRTSTMQSTKVDEATMKKLWGFERHLVLLERSRATVEKYTREVLRFFEYLNGERPTREAALRWKQEMQESGLNPRTINGKLCALSAFARFARRKDLIVAQLKVQPRRFRDEDREMTIEEFRRLVRAAQKLGLARTELLLEAMGGTGMRVSELQFLTVEACQKNQMEVYLKGKSRIVLLTKDLSRLLLKYAKKRGIVSGPIFQTKKGRPMTRQQIWKELKALCEAAGVSSKKVFPHNLRHLFARRLHEQMKDIAAVADVLGHSSLETTRIYLMLTTREYREKVVKLNMIV